MSDKNSTRLQEITDRWINDTEVQCEDWWYRAIRHVQRNMEGICVHEYEVEISDEEYGATHPSRYDGTRYAHAGADIAYLLSVVSDE